MNEEQQSYYIQLVSTGKIKEAIEELMESDFNNSNKKTLAGIAAQYQQWLQKKRQGLLSVEQESLQYNQIITRLIDYIKPSEPISTTSFSTSTKPPFWKSKSIQWLGIIGSLASIIALWFVFFPPKSDDSLQLTVFVVDSMGNASLEQEGELNIPLRNRSLNAAIGENGRTNFADIPASLKGTNITIGLDAEGWEIVDGKNTFIFTGDPIHLVVKRDNSLGIIKGIIKTQNGQNFIEGATVLINSDTSIQTNKQGIFKIILPTEMQVKNLSTPYHLTFSKTGFITKTKQYFPNTSDMDIRLEKQ